VNGVGHSVDVAPETPLLWVIRDQLGLTGTKFSCGISQCGACTLHIDGRPVRSCSVPVSFAVEVEIDHRRRVEGEQLAQRQAADHRVAERTAQAYRQHFPDGQAQYSAKSHSGGADTHAR
jgi:isoquinoline 1-oxidoreductase subunit alpha